LTIDEVIAYRFRGTLPLGDWPWNSEPHEDDFVSSGLRCYMRRAKEGCWVCYCVVPTELARLQGLTVNSFPRRTLVVGNRTSRPSVNYAWAYADPERDLVPLAWSSHPTARYVTYHDARADLEAIARNIRTLIQSRLDSYAALFVEDTPTAAPTVRQIRRGNG